MGGPDNGKGSIALVANYPSDVGYAWWLMENFWARIADHARAHGRECLLAYPEIRTVPAVIRDAPLQLQQFAFERDGLASVLRTARFLRAHRVSTVYLTDWPFLHFSYAVWRWYGVRRIVLHDHAPGARPAVGGLRGWLKRQAYRWRAFRCDQYVAVSKYVGQRHLENARMPAQLSVVVENGIMPFDPATADRAAVRRRLGIPLDACLVALVSRATYYKGIDFAVRAFARLRQTSRPVYAVHCGDGPDMEAFASLARELGVADRFLFLGKRADVRDILSSADIAFHPSRGEAMSLAILEFMCAGLPVVLPDDPSVRTSIENELSGLVYPAGDVAGAAAALQLLCDEPRTCARLGATARRICLEKYLLEHTNRSFDATVVARM